MRTVWRGRTTGGSIPRSDSHPDSPSIVTRAAVPSLPPIESPAAPAALLSIMSWICSAGETTLTPNCQTRKLRDHCEPVSF